MSQTTKSSRKGRTGVGPHHDLGKVATQISGGECLEPVTKASARDALSRIKRGYPPRAKMSWPSPATSSEELLEWPLTAPVNVAPSNCCEDGNSL